MGRVDEPGPWRRFRGRRRCRRVTGWVVAIDGGAGAGKSTVARALASKLGHAVSFPPTTSHRGITTGLTPRFMEQVLLPSQGANRRSVSALRLETRRLAEWMEVVPGPYLIIEGVSSSRLQFARTSRSRSGPRRSR